MKRCAGCNHWIWPWQRHNHHVAPMHIQCWDSFVRGCKETRIIREGSTPKDAINYIAGVLKRGSTIEMKFDCVSCGSSLEQDGPDSCEHTTVGELDATAIFSCPICLYKIKVKVDGTGVGI